MPRQVTLARRDAAGPMLHRADGRQRSRLLSDDGMAIEKIVRGLLAMPGDFGNHAEPAHGAKLSRPLTRMPGRVRRLRACWRRCAEGQKMTRAPVAGSPARRCIIVAIVG